MNVDSMVPAKVMVGHPLELDPTQVVPESPWSSIGFLWRRKLLVLFFTALGVALGYLYFLKQTPLYESQAQILVVSRDPTSLSPELHRGPTETVYDRTRIELLTSPLVIQDAIAIGRLHELPSLRGVENPVQTILMGLRVSGNDTTNRVTSDVLTLRYTSAFREDCPKVLTAIHKAFDNFMGKTFESINKDTFNLITEAKNDLDQQITDLERKYNEFRSSSDLLRQGESARNVHEERLGQIESVRSEAVVENSKLEAQIQAITAALQSDNRVDALRMLIQDIQGPSSTQLQNAVDMEAALLPMLVDEQRLLENYGEAHPKVIAIRKEIDLRREHLRGAAAADTAGTSTPEAIFQAYLQSLQEQIRINRATISEMDKLFEQEQAYSQAMLADQLKDENFKSELARKQRMFDAVVKRLEEISLLKEGGKIDTQLIFPPSVGVQIAPEPVRTFTIAGMFGLLAGVGLAYVLEASDRRFKSPEEIRHTLGTPVIGHIPAIAGDRKQRLAARQVTTADESLETIHAPRGRVAEAYRGLRTALYFGTRGRGHQVVQITSPNPGDGKTTVSANLAVSIAQSGKRVLLIDADFRRPRVHTLFNLQPEIGLSSVLSSNAEIEDATHTTPIPNLYLLPCGPRPENPSELLTMPRFDELLQVLREKYDFVIIDAPPILAVTDPLTLASRVDGVLLVMRLTKNARSLAARAINELSMMNASVLGVVVNAIGFTSGMGYGQYRPGFGSDGNRYVYGGYGTYGYGQEYGDGVEEGEDAASRNFVAVISHAGDRGSNGRG